MNLSNFLLISILMCIIYLSVEDHKHYTPKMILKTWQDILCFQSRNCHESQSLTVIVQSRLPILYSPLSRVQHRLCPSRFPPLFFASSRHPAQQDVSIPIPPACTCQRATDVNVTGRLVLKWIENTLHGFRTKGNIPEIRTWNPQWNVDMVEGQNRTATWKMSARGFSSLGISVCSKRYKILRNHLHHPVCSLCYWNSIFYIICSVQIKIQSRKKLWWEKNIKR